MLRRYCRHFWDLFRGRTRRWMLRIHVLIFRCRYFPGAALSSVEKIPFTTHRRQEATSPAHPPPRANELRVFRCGCAWTHAAGSRPTCSSDRRKKRPGTKTFCSRNLCCRATLWRCRWREGWAAASRLDPWSRFSPSPRLGHSSRCVCCSLLFCRCCGNAIHDPNDCRSTFSVFFAGNESTVILRARTAEEPLHSEAASASSGWAAAVTGLSPQTWTCGRRGWCALPKTISGLRRKGPVAGAGVRGQRPARGPAASTCRSRLRPRARCWEGQALMVREERGFVAWGGRSFFCVLMELTFVLFARNVFSSGELGLLWR